MKSLCSVLATTVLLAACTTAGSTPTQTASSSGIGASSYSEMPEPKSRYNSSIVSSIDVGSAQMAFIDIDSFDSNMAGVMNQGPDEVVVKMPMQVSLNDVPDRMNRWLSAVETTGGEIKLEKVADVNDPNTRGLGTSLISWVVKKLFDSASDTEEVPHAAASNYKTAIMTYDEKSGAVTQVSFYR